TGRERGRRAGRCPARLPRRPRGCRPDGSQSGRSGRNTVRRGTRTRRPRRSVPARLWLHQKMPRQINSRRSKEVTPAFRFPLTTSNLRYSVVGTHDGANMHASIGTVAEQFRITTNLFIKAMSGIETAEAMRRPGPISNPLLWLAGHVTHFRTRLLTIVGVPRDFPWG